MTTTTTTPRPTYTDRQVTRTAKAAVRTLGPGASVQAVADAICTEMPGLSAWRYGDAVTAGLRELCAARRRQEARQTRKDPDQ